MSKMNAAECCALCLYFHEYPWYVHRSDGYCKRPYCYTRAEVGVGDPPPLSIPHAGEVVCRYYVDRAAYFESLHMGEIVEEDER